MKKTRNLFVLIGIPEVKSIVLKQLDFKGITRFSTKVSSEQISKEFANNKSVICFDVPSEFETSAIKIVVGDLNHATSDDCFFIDIAGDVISQFQEIADKTNSDIGDHKKDCSGQNGIPSIDDCAYCKCIKDNFHDYKLSMNRVIYKSENFFVMPTLGEFLLGYMIIIPMEHVMSNAELSSSLQEEFLTVLDDVSYILNLTYQTSDFLVWENGTGNSGKGKAKTSVVHSHVHIAPSKLTASKIKEFSQFDFDEISYDELSSYGNRSYLLIRENKNSWFINSNSEVYIPRQYVRQLLAHEYKLTGDTWNWRTNPFPELMIKTVDDISFTLKSHWNELPERIKQNTKSFLF